MVLALDPHIPRAWRTPDTLQFGVDEPRLVLDRVSPAEERMIAALADGVSRSGLTMIAKRARAGDGAVEALLQRVALVLDAPEDRRGAPPLIVLDGDGPTAARIVGLLGAAGTDIRTGLAWSDPVIDTAALAVVVGSYAIAPGRHLPWLRRDIPHLPVVFGDGGAVVGPLVRPGRGACVRCVDLHRADADPAWPAMAAQLHSRQHPGETAVVCNAVAGVAVATALRALRTDDLGHGDDLGGSASHRFDLVSGAWHRREHMPHPECGCLALPVSRPRQGPLSSQLDSEPPAPPETARAGARRDDRDASHDAPS